METSLPQEWTALCLLVFVLGMRHGFDADHLATIDGLTRFNARSSSPWARWCGVLFSLGHGGVVVAIALLVSLASGSAKVPDWLEGFGTGISVLFLIVLGGANLLAVLRTPPAEMVQPVALKGRFLGRLREASHPGLVALVGALFALSFDTLSQAALFALTATRYGGWEHALVLGLIFMGGMLATDGINGFWIARLLRRADATALIASRVMGLTVAFVSLGVAAFAVAKWTLPAVDNWSEGKELLFGGLVMVLLATSFLVASRLGSGTATALNKP
jgi:high-affinity nickel-transport protein